MRVRVDVGGLRLFVDVVGSHLAPDLDEMRERPVLLVLHGGPGVDHSSGRPYFDRFSDTHCVVYFDHRGNGRSDQRDDTSGWDLDTWADDVSRLCDALELRSPALLGISFGGFVAAHAAGRHPDLASKLVLMSTFARRDEQVMLNAFERLGGTQAREAARRFWTTPSNETIAEYGALCLPLYTRRASIVTPGPNRTQSNVPVMMHFAAHVRPSMDLTESLAAVRCPTLVLVGEDDPICPPALSEAIVASLPAGVAQLEVLADCGHGTHFDQPDTTEALLRAFLSR